MKTSGKADEFYTLALLVRASRSLVAGALQINPAPVPTLLSAGFFCIIAHCGFSSSETFARLSATYVERGILPEPHSLNDK